MSHVATVTLEIRDLDALSQVVKQMGGTYNRQQVDWRWWGRWQDDYAAKDAAYKNGIAPERYGKADAGVISFPSCGWDIGVYKTPGKQGCYTLVYDNYSGGQGLEKVCGAGLSKINQPYAAAVTKKHLTRQGFRVVQQAVGGKVRLVAVR